MTVHACRAACRGAAAGLWDADLLQTRFSIYFFLIYIKKVFKKTLSCGNIIID